jgi:HAD superfamily hydrolase (TIGR01662 family)
MRPFDALLFDLGNTLIFSEGDWPEIFTKANAELIGHLKDEGIVLDEIPFLDEFSSRLEEYHRERESEFIEYTTAFILRRLLVEWGYPETPQATIHKALRSMYSVSQEHWHPEPSALPTLTELVDQGYRLGLISNASDDEDVQTLVDKAGLRRFFEVILSSAAAGIRKPHPGIFHRVLDQIGVSARRAAMIGDTLGADILGAQNAGLYAIWLTRYADVPANRAHQDTIQPHATIHSLAELPGLLKNLEEGE